MKRMVCEMCESTNFTKQDGVFVCGGCGTSYSVEEAKKLMVEVEGGAPAPATSAPAPATSAPAPAGGQNSAQIENLLKLAQSSYDSKNYSQAEEFCNQAIALDASNYEAWRLKGLAVFFQSTIENSRILEAYNCIITAYKVLDDESKKSYRAAIIKTLQICLNGEVDFYLEQFELQRPSNVILAKIKNAYIFYIEKIAEALAIVGFDENDIADIKQTTTNSFIKKVRSACVKTWNSTVYYNYFREGNWDINGYKPDETIAKTFVKETDILLSLLEYCTTLFTDSSSLYDKVNIYETMTICINYVLKAKYYDYFMDGGKQVWLPPLSVTSTSNGWKEKRTADLENYNFKIEQLFIKDCDEMSGDKILELAKAHLDKEKPIYAKHRYEAYIRKKPSSIIGYVGKAIAMRDAGEDEADILQVLLKSSQFTLSGVEKDIVKELVNRPCGTDDDKSTLLIIAAYNYNLRVVVHLINLGADINYRTPESKVTALWFVCRIKPKPEDEAAARKIAKLFLDIGASVDITNNGGIALFNSNTDPMIAQMIKEKNPSISKGAAPIKNATPPKSGGCYVATAVYGSYNCPEVWTLRRYRDNKLAKSIAGRAFIRTYYAVSPTIIKWFGETKWFNKMWKGTLDRMVERLQNEGFESTPYDDINW